MGRHCGSEKKEKNEGRGGRTNKMLHDDTLRNESFDFSLCSDKIGSRLSSIQIKCVDVLSNRIYFGIALAEGVAWSSTEKISP
jgi:hypothetical protein